MIYKYARGRQALLPACSGKVKLVNSVNPLAFRFTFTIIDYRSIMLSNTNPQLACK